MEVRDYYCTTETKSSPSPAKSRKPKLVYSFFFHQSIKNASLLMMPCTQPVLPTFLSLQNKYKWIHGGIAGLGPI